MARKLWSNYEVTELTWENGQLAMHELGGVGHAGDTLESIVHQATYCNTLHPNPNPTPIMAATADQNSGQNMNKAASFGSPSLGKWADNSGPVQNPAPLPPPPSGPVKKRSHSETEQYSRLPNDLDSACASANAAFCRDNNDTTMMTWASYESPRSCTRTKTTTDEDSACQGGSGNHEEDRETKGETGRSFTTRKGRAAAVHNQSERRRRDRINQKMKALQKLVPNASKTDKASMLDEVIDYLKQLQAQVQMMSSARFMPQMMMPAAAAAALGMQQQLQQMSLLARMGIGIGMMDTPTPNIPQTLTPAQLVHPSQVAPASSGFVPPGAFVVPPMIPQANPSAAGPSSSAPLQDHYAALLAQSMNMDLYNTMAALQRQQQQTPQQPTSTQLQLNHHIQGGQGN